MPTNKDNTPIMERIGVKYLYKMHQKNPPERIDIEAYILDEEERANINRIGRNAIIRATLAGAVSTIISGMCGFYADPLLDKAVTLFSKENFYYWLIVGGSTIVASLLEIIYLYYDILRTTHKLANAAHLELKPSSNKKECHASSLARAAFELPNGRESDLRIDPNRESSKILLALISIIYKLKISVTNFLVKALLTRMMGRAVSRAWLNFIAVPVCAFWNGWVAWLVVNELKIRVLGPSAANEIIHLILEHNADLSENAKITLLRAVGSCIVRTEDLHPNLEYLYRAFDRVIEEPEGIIIDDTNLFLSELAILEQNEKLIVLQTLIFASIIDGKITLKEKKLLSQAFKVCNIEFRYENIKNLVRRYRDGELVFPQISL